jgi:hypothetical protein
MIAATTTSGHSVPVPNTPAAASKTAKLPSTSLRVQIHLSACLHRRRDRPTVGRTRQHWPNCPTQWSRCPAPPPRQSPRRSRGPRCGRAHPRHNALGSPR